MWTLPESFGMIAAIVFALNEISSVQCVLLFLPHSAHGTALAYRRKRTVARCSSVNMRLGRASKISTALPTVSSGICITQLFWCRASNPRNTRRTTRAMSFNCCSGILISRNGSGGCSSKYSMAARAASRRVVPGGSSSLPP